LQKFFASFFQKRSAFAAAAACLAAPALGRADTTQLHYTARLHGVPLLEAVYCVHREGSAYAASLAAKTLGLAEWIAHARSISHVEGSLEGQMVRPRDYQEHGRLSGAPHQVAIDYQDGAPVLTQMSPALEKSRLPVPAAQTMGAVDGLSALMLESLAATRTGACDGQALVYDGFQLRRATTHTEGQDDFKPSATSMFSGPALRCATTSEMLAGYLKSEPIAKQARPRFSKTWLAPLRAGGERLIVHATFDADLLGDIIVDLDSVTHPDNPGCAPPPES
jgi:hypothetical protein